MIFPKIVPIVAPKTNIGKKIPPGTPELKQIIENSNFTTKSKINI